MEAICVNERISGIGDVSKRYIELQFEMIDGFVGMIESFQFDLKSTAFNVCEQKPDENEPGFEDRERRRRQQGDRCENPEHSPCII